MLVIDQRLDVGAIRHVRQLVALAPNRLAVRRLQLSQLLGYCEIVNEGRSITFFEITTAAAFRAFAETPADILLLECGLGGRYDSTNVVDRPALTAITPVSMDHMQFLGETLAEIAGEKAAIQKAGVPSIIGEQSFDAADVIAWTRERIAAFKAPKSVDVIPVMPRNASGKILRRELRAPYWEGQERQVS